MKILKGISLAPGITEGIVSLYISEIEKTLPHYSINSKQIPNELNRLNESIRNARRTILIKTKRLNVEHAIHDIFEEYIREYQTEGILSSKNA